MNLLSIEELKELRDALVKVTTYTEDLKKGSPVARFIKAPQVPAAFSESLTVHLLQRKNILPELTDTIFKIGGLADIVGLKNGNQIKIEVKATGDKGFQRLGQKDLAADYLVWIHFDTFFKGAFNNPISVWTVQKPGDYFQKIGILSVAEFKLRTATARKELLVSFNEIL